MGKSIINSHLLEKKTLKEAIELLGDCYYLRGDVGTETTKNFTQTLVYVTNGRGNFIDVEMLCVEIKNDTVEKIYLDYD